MQSVENEVKLSQVPGENPARQGRETPSRWDWVERSVWSARMLNALETGVKGAKWYSLIDKVYNPANLEAACNKVVGNRGAAGVDRVSVHKFNGNRAEELRDLNRQLRDGTYKPAEIRRVYIPKAGSAKGRPLGIPVVRDRTVQTALRNVCEPIFEREFAERSYGFRPNRSCKDALREVDKYLRGNYHWVVDVDIRSYFDTIPHDELLNRVAERIADTGVLGLIRGFLKQRVMESLGSLTPENGTPQGAVISPLLSNIYLNPLDHLMSRHGYIMVRYADDMVVLCKTQQQAIEAKELLKSWLTEMKLELNEEKTRLVDVSDKDSDGFDFLGYHFQKSKKDPTRINHWPRKRSLVKLHDRIRPITKRLSGQSMDAITKTINPILRGWFGYFKHSRPERVFEDVDGWVRTRLRGILRHRRKRRGRATVKDQKLWPNAYFIEIGLYSLQKAWMDAVQSHRGTH